MPYADRNPQEIAPPIEPVSAVHQNAISILFDVENSLSVALAKFRGAQPEQTNMASEKAPSNVMSDARVIRDLAGRIMEKSQELHRYIGHEK